MTQRRSGQAGALNQANLNRFDNSVRDIRLKTKSAILSLGLALVCSASAQVAKLSPLHPVPISQVHIADEFWTPKMKTWRDVTIPDCFAKFEKDGTLTNFIKIRDDQTGTHHGLAWFDGLLYEMITGTADFLAVKRDPTLERQLDGYIEIISAAAAKDPNGYLNTCTQLKEPTHRWGQNGGDDNLQHDVYNASAMIEAGVHYYRATGKTQLLQTATRLANHMADLMGPPPKQNIVPGHSLGEAALIELYQLFKEQPQLKARLSVPVNEEAYLKLAEFWIENRGHHEGRKNFGLYGQDHKPVLEQQTIEGHAVRATLLCAGVTATAMVNGRDDYLQAAQRLWENMVQRRMYVNGGLGAVAGHEGFGPDYVLPNNGYLETCAAIGAGFFHQNLTLALHDARYADELERVLFNSVLSGVSLKGDSYFYENPLEAGPQRKRWSWHACPCCPPMFLKIMGALPGYIYAQGEREIYVNQFIGSRADIVLNGTKVNLEQTTRYPWDGKVKLVVNPELKSDFALNIRLPAWCHEPSLTVNGKSVAKLETARGYARLQRQWKRDDAVELTLPMPAERLKAHPAIEANVGRVALRRGPIVYCLEAADNNGRVCNLAIPPATPLRAEYRADFLGGVTIVRGTALAVTKAIWPDQAYLPTANLPGVTNVEFTAIPYYANANRDPGEMATWIPEDVSLAQPALPITKASTARPSASHCFDRDTVQALNDQLDPAASDDGKIPRFTWWNHRGTSEWVQYDFAQPTRVSAVEVYWWDERRINAHCRVPQSWRLLYQDNGQWKPVAGANPYATEMDKFNRVTFTPVETKALRIEAQLQPDWSGGILEWRIE